MATGGYQVRELPASMRQMIWRYGALSAQKERDYIESKMDLMGIGNENIRRLETLSARHVHCIKAVALQLQEETQGGVPDRAIKQYLDCWSGQELKLKSSNLALASHALLCHV